MKCPVCGKGELSFVADAAVVFDLIETKDGKIAAVNPKVGNVFDEVRTLSCSSCSLETSSDLGSNNEVFEDVFDKVVVWQNNPI